jgi:hypothetical protein
VSRGALVAPGRGRAPRALVVVAGLVGLAVVGSCADDGGPRLVAVSPEAAARDAVVTITGRRLCGARGDCTQAAGEIQLGIEPPVIRARVVSYSDTAAEIAIPSLASVGATTLIVTVGERSSNALGFEVLP